MRLRSVLGNAQRLDGGSMFGNCPRAVWERWAPADEAHRIDLACRCLLVEHEGKKILLETGIGAFFAPKLKDRFGVMESEHVLIEGLAALGVAPEEIDIIVISHLHFDHAGGLLTPYVEGGEFQLAFPKAKYIVGQRAWERALTPHSRDRASFLPELNALLEASGRLIIVPEGETSCDELGEAFSFSYSDGHTPGLLLTRVQTDKGPVTFMGDLIPGTPWVHLPITMGYDRYPERVIDEKLEMLSRVIDESGWAFFTHDPNFAACRVERNEKGKFVPVEKIEALDWDA
jgi:glyoxylase-like metal-dependent hydrolase (beta-lactamase superfamily II)